jgi:hypothetical protein
LAAISLILAEKIFQSQEDNKNVGLMNQAPTKEESRSFGILR